MRVWYWFLFVLLLVGISLVFVGEYLVFIQAYRLGFEFSVYGSIMLAFVVAVAFYVLKEGLS